MEGLIIVPISQVAATQRAGRAGRTMAGKCFRLYSSASYASLLEETIPEIQRSNLVNSILYLKVLGISNVLAFDYIDRPDDDTILNALSQLFCLGALDSDGKVTNIGKVMAGYPVNPSLAKTIITASTLQCLTPVLDMVAMLSTEAVWKSSNDDKVLDARLELYHVLGDHFTLGTLLQKYKRAKKSFRNAREERHWMEQYAVNGRGLKLAGKIVTQLQDMVKKNTGGRRHGMENQKEVKEGSREWENNIVESFASGFFMHAATRGSVSSSMYRVYGESEYQVLHLHPTCCLPEVRNTLPSHVLYHEMLQTSKRFMRNVLQVPVEMITKYRITCTELHQLYRLSDQKLNTSHETKEGAEETIIESKKNEKRNGNKKTIVTLDALEEARIRYLNRKRQKKE